MRRLYLSEAQKSGDVKHLSRMSKRAVAKAKKMPLAPLPSRPMKTKKSQAKKRGTTKKCVHHGRFLVLTGRESGSTVLLPMPPKAVSKGAAPPAEAKKDVGKAFSKHVDIESCFVATDSAKAFAAEPNKICLPFALLAFETVTWS